MSKPAEQPQARSPIVTRLWPRTQSSRARSRRCSQRAAARLVSALLRREPEARQHRYEGEREDQRTEQREGERERHWREDALLDALEGEDRQERGDHDRLGEQDRPAHGFRDRGEQVPLLDRRAQVEVVSPVFERD